MDRGVVSDERQLAALQAQQPVGLRPAAVVADGHAEDASERAVDPEAVAGLEVVALEVLELPPRLVLVVAR